MPVALNLSLLVLYPLAWWAPLARAGVMPIFGGEEISILTGIAALWETDIFLCAIVLLFAVIAPYAKALALSALHFGYAGRRILPAIKLFGRLSMADVFLIAFYVVLVKGVGVGYVEIAWGLYLFTALVLTSLVLAWSAEPTKR
ncbi:MAG: paraquat-inducible protein A [Pseudomonadota bacterium]